MTAQEEKWFWMMDWCKKHYLPPANTEIWKQAEEAWKEFNKEPSVVINFQPYNPPGKWMLSGKLPNGLEIPAIAEEPRKAGCADGGETVGYFAAEISRLRSELSTAQKETEKLRSMLNIWKDSASDTEQRLYQARAEAERFRTALENIMTQQPCLEGGGCFYPMFDGDGEYIGEQNVDPISVIGGMVETAQDALSK